MLRMRIAICIQGLCLLVAAGQSPAASYYVATNGSDAAAGTLDAPFATIQHAANTMTHGDTCLIRAGSYHEEVTVTNKNDLSFAAFDGETVLMDGTRPITNAWNVYSNAISRTVLTNDIWQLFVDGEMVMPARWPNASLYDETVWDQDGHWAELNYSSSLTSMTDKATGHSDLSALPFSVSNAMAVLNVGSFKTYTRRVLSHTNGNSAFTVDPVGSRKSSNHQYYFLEDKLEFLDAEGEWYFNPVDKKLYLWGDTNAVIRGKVQDYAFRIVDCEGLTISGIDFFGTTVHFSNCSDSRVEKGTFDYPSCTRRVLGETDTTPPSTTFAGGSGNVFYNNTMRYAGTHAVYMHSASDNRIENCLFEYIDWSCADLPNLMGTIYMRGSGSIFRSNTVHTAGASEVLDFNDAPVVEYCRFYNHGIAQNDGAAVQLTIGTQPASVTAYNWFHDTEKYGARFDASTAPGSSTGSDGLMHHNVGFRLKSAIMQKGDFHRCINNTAFDNDNNGIIILDDNISSNTYTVTRNNAAEKLSGSRSSNQALPGDRSHNWNGYQNGSVDMRTLLRDPDNLDFRPIPGSVLVDAGLAQAGITDGYLGEAPDIGAYEFNDPNYWIPGRRTARASMPVPPNGSVNVKGSAALMWLPGLDATSCDVYLGTGSNAVAGATSASPEFQTNQSNNVYDPLGLFEQTYYWRIDSLTPAGTVTGAVWSFTASNVIVQAPGVVNSQPEDVTYFSATIGGAITDSGTASRVWIHWWPDGGATSIVYKGAQAGAFSTGLTGLQSNGVYHYRSYAENSYGSNWAASVESFAATGSLIWTELTCDDFESGFGNFTDGGANCHLYTGGAYAHQGLNAINIERHSEAGSFAHSAGIDVDTPDYSKIKVTFWFYPVSMDPPAADNFFVQYYDGSAWITLRDYVTGVDFTNNVFQYEELIVEESSTTFPTNMKIRFMCDANGLADDVFIDEVCVSALGAVPPPAPYVVWAGGYGLSGTNADFTADPDGDGLYNLGEYGLGGVPTNGGDAASIAPTIGLANGGGSNKVEYVYRRRIDAAVRGLYYYLELTDDLLTGIWGTNGYVETGTEPLELSFEAVTNGIINSRTNQFIRLRIGVQ